MRVLLLVPFLWCYSTLVLADDVFSSENIADILHLLKSNDIELKKSTLAEEQARFSKRESLGGLLPSLDLNYTGRNVDRKKENKIKYEDSTVELKLTQKLFDHGTLSNNRKARLELQKSQTQLDVSYIERLFALASSLVKLVEFNRSVEIYDEQIAFMQEQEKNWMFLLRNPRLFLWNWIKPGQRSRRFLPSA